MTATEATLDAPVRELRRARTKTTEEITPSMIDAGIAEIEASLGVVSYESLVRKIYNAMKSQAPRGRRL